MLIPEFLIIYPWAMNFSGYSRRGVSLISRIRGTPWEEIEDYSVSEMQVNAQVDRPEVLYINYVCGTITHAHTYVSLV